MQWKPSYGEITFRYVIPARFLRRRYVIAARVLRRFGEEKDGKYVNAASKFDRHTSIGRDFSWQLSGIISEFGL